MNGPPAKAGDTPQFVLTHYKPLQGPVSLCLRPDTSPLSAASAVGTAEVRAALCRANAEARRLAELVRVYIHIFT